MQVLWRQETATALEIVHAIQQKRNVSKRTVKTLLGRLVVKQAVGYIVDANNSRLYHYRALVTQQDCTGDKADAFMEIMAEEEMGEALLRFVGGSKLSKKQIEKLEKLLEQKKEELEP